MGRVGVIMGPMISPTLNFPCMAQPTNSFGRAKYLLYCKLRKKSISRKKWSRYRFSQYLLAQKKFTKAELIRFKLLPKRQLYASNADLHSSEPRKKRGRPRLITVEQERKLVEKYKTMHRDGHAAKIRNLQSDVCILPFNSNILVENFLGFTTCPKKW